jgi:biotin operon repressor
MDYREIVEAEKWHLTNSGLSGLEIKVLFTMMLSANYKTGLLSISQDDLAKTLKISRQAVSKPIQKLLKIGAILQTSVGMGRAPSSFKIRSSEDMDLLCSKEVTNPEVYKWFRERDNLFFDFDTKVDHIGHGCEECTEDGMCHEHLLEKRDIENSPEGKARRLWISDHPEPAKMVKIISLPGGDKDA